MGVKIYSTPRDSRQQWADLSDTSLLAFEFKPLPGAGAGQYAWETLGLPVYPVYGRGNLNVVNPSFVSSPFGYAYHAVGLVGIPPTGILQGQFATQPLMDPDQAMASGVTTQQVPNAPTAGAFNSIPVMG